MGAAPCPSPRAVGRTVGNWQVWRPLFAHPPGRSRGIAPCRFRAADRTSHSGIPMFPLGRDLLDGSGTRWAGGRDGNCFACATGDRARAVWADAGGTNRADRPLLVAPPSSPSPTIPTGGRPDSRSLPVVTRKYRGEGARMVGRGRTGGALSAHVNMPLRCHGENVDTRRRLRGRATPWRAHQVRSTPATLGGKMVIKARPYGRASPSRAKHG